MRINSFFATTVSITMLLLLGGVATYLMLGANAKAVQLKSEFTLSIYLQDTISKVDRLQIESNLNGDKNVEAVRFVSAEQAAGYFSRQISVEFRSLFDNSPLPASFEVNLKPSANVKAFEKQVAAWPGVEDVNYPHALAGEVSEGIVQLSFYIIGFAVVLAFVFFIVLRNTVKMDVAASSDRIARAVHQRMPIVQIRSPFMLRAYSQGALAGALSCVFLYLATDGIATLLPLSKLPVDMPLMGVIFSVMILIGILFTSFFTYLTVNEQIKNSLKKS